MNRALPLHPVSLAILVITLAAACSSSEATPSHSPHPVGGTDAGAGGVGTGGVGTGGVGTGGVGTGGAVGTGGVGTGGSASQDAGAGEGGAPGGGGTDYHVGPGQMYTTIGAVPWASLKAGDTVYIHYRASPYAEHFLISSTGTASQWIRVRGVPGPNGELPIIEGADATTSTTNHFHWQAPNLTQFSGLIHVEPNADVGVPAEYVEIAGLEVRGCLDTNSFTAENGATQAYDTFCAGVFTHGVKHLLVRDNVLHDNRIGVYDWEGDGSAGGNTYWDSTTTDVVVRGNLFYDNGNPSSYTEHQAYTESDGVIYEYNHFGPMKTGALGSQIKDRSAGTIIRYNYIEQSPQGYNLDLVEPQNGWPVLGVGSGTTNNPRYGQDFVYGNVFVNHPLSGTDSIHWNEDQQVGQGRATLATGRLYLYANTFLTTADALSWGATMDLLNETWGGFDCPAGPLPGRVDARNNVFAFLPQTPGQAARPMLLEHCGLANIDFGVNWISPGFSVGNSTVTGQPNLISPSANDPAFVDLAGNDLHLTPTSTAYGVGGALAPAVINNVFGVDLTPVVQYVFPHTSPPSTKARTLTGVGSDLGAFGR
jgi:hypothetical protein